MNRNVEFLFLPHSSSAVTDAGNAREFPITYTSSKIMNTIYMEITTKLNEGQCQVNHLVWGEGQHHIGIIKPVGKRNEISAIKWYN